MEIQIAQYFDIVKNGPKYPHENVSLNAFDTQENGHFRNNFKFKQKFIKDGKILMPFGPGPTFANCFMNVLFNEPISRESMAGLYQ